MSLLSWFRRKPAPSPSQPAAQPSGLQADATVPLGTGKSLPPAKPPAAPAGMPRNERMERRELLYGVVRDAMVKVGILTAGYKFKVLSLDQRGRQFLVMMDLAREYGGATAKLNEIELLIAQTAKARYDILVTAVYWRINEQVAVGLPPKAAAAAAAPARPVRPPAGAAASAPAPLTASTPVPRATAPTSRPAPLQPSVAPAVAAPLLPARPAPAPARSASGFEPIEADEVMAFKRALAQSGTGAGAMVRPAASPRTAPDTRGAPLLPLPEATGFEDTEMPGADAPSPDLSSTQYGELR